MKTIIALFICFIQTQAFADSTFICSNRQMEEKLKVSFHKKGALLSAGKQRCDTEYIQYTPRSHKYKGWMRMAPKNGCTKLGSVLLGTTQYNDVGLEIHWLTISREMQNDEKGSALLGFENDADPGAGATAKIFLYCFPAE